MDFNLQEFRAIKMVLLINISFFLSSLWFIQLPASLHSKVNKPNIYHETKQVAVEYQTAKESLFKAFLKAGLGAWVEKPIEQDQFSLVVWITVCTSWDSDERSRFCINISSVHL